jgi:Protein of unknown function (DUF2946)
MGEMKLGPFGPQPGVFMDDLVKQSLLKWPHVPHCYGWLGLDGRGNWYLRDDATQAQGAFAASKGDRLEHAALRQFIERNYTHDDGGQWYFQNGPQRVYVELAYTPWIWRLKPFSAGRESEFGQEGASSGAPHIESHTGLSTQLLDTFEDEWGQLYLLTPLGVGLVHTQDMWLAAEGLEHFWPAPQRITQQELPTRFKFVQSPWARQRETPPQVEPTA